jgi:RecQ zinc-binding
MKLIDDDDGKVAAKLDEASRDYATRAERDRGVLERMIAAQGAQCRWRMLLDYFARDMDDARASDALCATNVHYRMPDDELDGKTCGVCDNCLHPPQVIESPRELREQAWAEEDSRPTRTARRFEPGERVRVRRYGEGVVEMVSGERVAVRFPDDATRTFIVQYVKRGSRRAIVRPADGDLRGLLRLAAAQARTPLCERLRDARPGEHHVGACAARFAICRASFGSRWSVASACASACGCFAGTSQPVPLCAAE